MMMSLLCAEQNVPSTKDRCFSSCVESTHSNEKTICRMVFNIININIKHQRCNHQIIMRKYYLQYRATTHVDGNG